MNTAINLDKVSKNFADVKALSDVSFEVKTGEIFGLIGADGAGKTTLIRILTSLYLPDEGTAKVLEYDVVKDYKKIRKIIGYMPGRFALYQDLTIEENMEFFARVFGTTIKENYDLVKPIYSQIEKFKDRPAGKLSGGMKQKLALSCALIHKPKVLFLDEPTTGVDPVSRKEFWDMLANLKQQGITIFVSTPYMDEASLCDRIALIQSGRILSIDTPEQIRSQFKHNLYSIKANNMYYLIKALREHPETHSVHTFGECVHYTPSDNIFNTHELMRYLEDDYNLKSVQIEEIRANIEDCFIDLMVKQ